MPANTDVDVTLCVCAGLVGICILAYLIQAYRNGSRSLDLNKLVPLLLGCTGVIAGAKLFVDAFVIAQLAKAIQNEALSQVDSQLIMIAGAVFFTLSFYEIFKSIDAVGGQGE